jgi:hypothetical protein
MMSKRDWRNAENWRLPVDERNSSLQNRRHLMDQTDKPWIEWVFLPAYTHVGNVRFRHMIEEQGSLHEKASLADKVKLHTDDVVDLIHKSSGRFLKDDGACWVEVSDFLARKKVAQAFRTWRHFTKAAESD